MHLRLRPRRSRSRCSHRCSRLGGGQVPRHKLVLSRIQPLEVLKRPSAKHTSQAVPGFGAIQGHAVSPVRDDLGVVTVEELVRSVVLRERLDVGGEILPSVSAGSSYRVSPEQEGEHFCVFEAQDLRDLRDVGVALAFEVLVDTGGPEFAAQTLGDERVLEVLSGEGWEVEGHRVRAENPRGDKLAPGCAYMERPLRGTPSQVFNLLGDGLLACGDRFLVGIVIDEGHVVADVAGVIVVGEIVGSCQTWGGLRPDG